MSRSGAERERAAVHIRVSTEDQAANGVSLAMQETRLRALCKERGWKVAGVYRDGHSAKNVKRPALQRLLGDAVAGKFDVVCAHKLDRLTRSVRDLYDLLETFKKRRVAIVSAAQSIDATTLAGQAMVGMIGVFAQWERESIGARIADALRHKRREGKVYGSTPYGFERDGDCLVPKGAQLGVVRGMHRLHRKCLPLHAIARKLNGGGVYRALRPQQRPVRQASEGGEAVKQR